MAIVTVIVKMDTNAESLESCHFMQVKDLNLLSHTITGPTILDCRQLSQSHLVENCPTLATLIQLPLVRQIWLAKSSPGEFHEMKGRLKSCFKLNEVHEAAWSMLLKMTRHDRDLDPSVVFALGQSLVNLGGAITDLKRVSDCHPGMSTILLLACKNLKEDQKRTSLKRKSIEVDSNAYSDTRRPKKTAFRHLKAFRLQREVPVSKPCSRRCYMCKKHKDQPLPDFGQICSPCAHLNSTMRDCHVDMSGRYAVVTGARIKIGLETALRLLRNGCTVVATTRFPTDALRRYKLEEDFDQWHDRLRICYLDLENLRSVNEFLQVTAELPHLDILVNNAAQTIHRPPEYYRKLEALELEAAANSVNSDVIRTIQYRGTKQCHSTVQWLSGTDNLISNNNEQEFPLERVDAHGEQLDLRMRNSWTYNLDEVPLKELLQVLTINTVGPFLLTSRLKPLLKRSPFPRRFVVNVSAMEGQFSRESKGHRHPHTNMAKAALNMLTRTSGLEYQMDGIFMTAVDTGWVTDERPHRQARHEADLNGFEPPLNCKDGAARVFHPIWHGLQEDNLPYFAVFLKDFVVHDW